MPAPIIRPEDTARNARQSTLMFPVTYYDVWGRAIEHEDVRARDLSTAVACACRRVQQHREATGMHVGRGRS